MARSSDNDRQRRREKKKQRRAARKEKEARKQREEPSVTSPPTPPAGGAGGGGEPPGEPPVPEKPEPFRPVTTVEQARQVVRDLGIEHIHIADPASRRPSQRRAYLEILNYVLEPLHALHQRGRLMPPCLRVDPALFAEDVNERQAVFEPYGDLGPELWVNPDPDLWSTEYAARQHDLQRFSTEDQRATTYHEYLHFRIFERNALIYIALQAGELLQEEVRQLCEQVSEYATENGLEFASEVYAALRTGHPGYNREVMSLYNQILGFAGLQEEEL
jgi:hypothetical protein